MAIQFWQDMSILVGDLEMAGNAKDVSLTTDVVTLDKTSLAAQGWTEVTGGLKSGAVAISEFMQDVDESSVDATLWPLLGTAGVPKSICTATADGSPAYLLKSIPLSYTPITGKVGDLATGSISGASSTGPVVRGVVLHPRVARTSSAAGTGRQIGAVSAGQKVYAALHVTAVSGTSPTLDVIVQSDDNADFSSPTTRLTFTQATGRTSQLLSLTGAVTDDYWRVSYTIGGTDDPTFTFAVTCGVI